MFSGDTLFCGGPGATGRSHSDFPTIIESIGEAARPPPQTVVHRHGESTTVGDEAPHLEDWLARGTRGAVAARFPRRHRPVGSVTVSSGRGAGVSGTKAQDLTGIGAGHRWGSGIGLACAQRLAADGASVTLVGRSEDRLKAGVAAVGRRPRRLVAARARPPCGP